jgi:hypothetical protein
MQKKHINRASRRATLADVAHHEAAHAVVAVALDVPLDQMAEAKAVMVRLPEDELARVEAQRERLRQSGVTLSLSATIRVIVKRGLTVLEAEAGEGRPRKGR